MGKKRLDPLTALLMEMGSAAAHPQCKLHAERAAREAARIPLTLPERFHTRKGRLIAHGRALMRQLAQADDADRPTIAKVLRDCAGALRGWHRQDVVEDVLGAKKRGAA